MAYNSANFEYHSESPLSGFGRVYKYTTTDNLSVIENPTYPFYFVEVSTAIKLRTNDLIAVTAADKKALFRTGIVAPAESGGYVQASKIVEVSDFVGLITI